MEREKGEEDAVCVIASPPSPYSSCLDVTRLLVTVNDARRYLATSRDPKEGSSSVFFPEKPTYSACFLQITMHSLHI